jgi:hypothetical protein
MSIVFGWVRPDASRISSQHLDGGRAAHAGVLREEDVGDAARIQTPQEAVVAQPAPSPLEGQAESEPVGDHGCRRQRDGDRSDQGERREQRARASVLGPAFDELADEARAQSRLGQRGDQRDQGACRRTDQKAECEADQEQGPLTLAQAALTPGQSQAASHAVLNGCPFHRHPPKRVRSSARQPS